MLDVAFESERAAFEGGVGLNWVKEGGVALGGAELVATLTAAWMLDTGLIQSPLAKKPEEI